MSKIVTDLNVLRQKSTPVSIDETKDIIAKLQNILAKTDNGVGLAAIQIGIPKQVAVIKNSDGFLNLINAEIIKKEDEFVYLQEGCLSFPGVFNNTTRYRQVGIKNYRIEEDKLEEEILDFYYPEDTGDTNNDGLLCIAVQHEIEHFSGKLIVDFNVKKEPIKRDSIKVGRNDKCPCGSGKKYKRCCGS